jgi:hypothetical protein
VDIWLHCSDSQSGQTVLETVCGAGVYNLLPFTAANISYVTGLDETSTVVRLHHCIDATPLSGETLVISEDTNLCSLEGGASGNPRWNDSVCAVEINPPFFED